MTFLFQQIWRNVLLAGPTESAYQPLKSLNKANWLWLRITLILVLSIHNKAFYYLSENLTVNTNLHVGYRLRNELFVTRNRRKSSLFHKTANKAVRTY